MSWITFVTLAIASCIATPLVQAAALWFLSFQICLSYITAGIAKLTAQGWRNGSCITAITNLKIYGNPFLGAQMLKRPQLALVAAWLVMAWETLFPLVLLLPTSCLPYFLGSGILFHTLNAWLMGLNCFFWSFLATYPAIFFVVNHR